MLCLFRSTFPKAFSGFPLSFPHLSFSPVSGCFVVIWGCHIWDKTCSTLHFWILCSGYLGLLWKMFLLTLCEKQTLMLWWYCIKYLSVLVIWPFKHFQCNHGMSFHLLGYLHFLSLVFSNFHFSGLFTLVGFIARMNTYILSYYEWNFSSFLMSSWLVYRQTTPFCMLIFALVHSWICFSSKKLKNFCWSL